MSHPALPVAWTASRPLTRAADFVALAKPRILLFVLFAALTGALLGGPAPALLGVAAALAGTALAAAGSMILNQVLERDLDARMERTRRRPVPDGRVSPRLAAWFGGMCLAGGVATLALAANLLSASVAAATAVWYLWIYTPLKRQTALCFLVGAAPGAAPPVIGWAAVAGEIPVGAWILFGILFLWQVPHTLAIARLYHRDYARAGIRVLPVEEPDGAGGRRHVIASSLALLAVGLLPTLVGMAGPVYFLAAFGLGIVLLGFGSRLQPASRAADRRLLFATLAYLPILFAVMLLDAPSLELW